MDPHNVNSRGVSSEIGPPLFPHPVTPSAKDATGAARGLLKTLFGLAPPNSHSTIVSRGSFKDLNFTGGEDEAQDAWRDKWEAHRRASLDGDRRARSSDPGGGGDEAGGGASGISRLSRPMAIRSGDVYSVATGRAAGGGAAGGAVGGGGGASSAASSLGTSSDVRGVLSQSPMSLLGRQARFSDPSWSSSSSSMYQCSFPPGPSR